MTQAFNLDCMEGMKTFPDKFFDLAVVDPPYGGGASSQIVQAERERESSTAAMPIMNGDRAAGSDSGLIATISASRTGGTWAAKFRNRRWGRTSATGMSRPRPNTSASWLASARCRSSGAGITSTFRRLAAS